MLLPCPCIEPRRSSAQRLSNEVRSHRRKREGTGSYSTLRWLLYAGCSTLFFVITLVLLCFGSTLFWLYGACSLRFPYLRHEPPQNLHQISTYRISTASLPNLCRISAESTLSTFCMPLFCLSALLSGLRALPCSVCLSLPLLSVLPVLQRRIPRFSCAHLPCR